MGLCACFGLCVFRSLLQKGATPLIIASQKGHKEAMKLLFAAKANVDQAKEVGSVKVACCLPSFLCGL